MTGKMKEKITTSQATMAIASFIISDGFIVTARSGAQAVGTPDVWISLFGGGLVCMFLGVLEAKMSARFPGKTYFQYAPLIVGRWVGFLCSLLFIVYFLWLAAHELRIQAEFMQHFLLNRTPISIMMMAYLGVGLYLITGGINPLVRIQELLFPFTIVVIVVVFALSLKDISLDNLRPVLSEGIFPVMKGMTTTPFAYLGFETILLLTAFMEKTDKAVKSVFISLLLSTILYVLNGVLLVGVLTEKEVMTLTWPLMEFTRGIEIPGGFFENFEVLFFIIWLIRFFSTFTLAYYFGSLGLSQLFRLKITYFIYALAPIVFYIGLRPKNIDEVFQRAKYIGIYGVVFAGLLPILLYAVACVRRSRA